MFSDNGGEFFSREFIDFCENFNIKVSTTPAELPWSNGICERHNAILTDIILKVKEDINCSWETALAWALNAKNSFINVSGFSPHQLVFGKNINLPSTLNDTLSAGHSDNPLILEHLKSLHSAREAFMKSESSNKLRIALRKQTRNTREHFDLGQEVYYKRKDDVKWKGPGKVIGQDGPVVFIRHGGFYIKVHCCRVQIADSQQNEFSQNVPSDDIYKEVSKEPEIDMTNNTKTMSQEIFIDSDTEDEQLPDTLKENINDNENRNLKKIKETTNQVPLINVNDNSDISDLQGTKPKSFEPERPDSQLEQQNIKLMKGQIVTFKLHDNTYTVEIIGRAGKAKGQYKNCFNVEYKKPSAYESTQGHVNFDKVNDIKVIDKTEQVLIVDDECFDSAKEKELSSWKQNNVYVEVPYNGQNLISLKWVCTLKTVEENTVPKARLVAKGFEERYNEQIPKDSPTCSRESLRTVMAITAQKKWKLNSIDIKTAFLQGEEIDREIYVLPPKEALTNKVWLLKKCIYGLGDAS